MDFFPSNFDIRPSYIPEDNQGGNFEKSLIFEIVVTYRQRKKIVVYRIVSKTRSSYMKFGINYFRLVFKVILFL